MALPADLFLQAWRPSAYVISGTINWLGMFFVGMFFSYIVVRQQCVIRVFCPPHTHAMLTEHPSVRVSTQDGLGQFCFLIFAVYSILSALFLIWFVPETKGKTMVEIMEDFNKLNYKKRDTALATKL